MPAMNGAAATRPTESVNGDVALTITSQTDYSKLMNAPIEKTLYYDGDAYDDTRLVAEEWKILNMTKFPYLAHVKAMSAAWLHLRYLADFMEVTTTPRRWQLLAKHEDEIRERACRTNVAIIDFPESKEPICRTAKRIHELREHLSDTSTRAPCRLIVAEDLSREVIELLGSKFDIDPTFFLEHIGDHSWYNIRDRWMTAPNLKSAIKMQNWARVRFIRARYFRDLKGYEDAEKEVGTFNILRRIDNEQNHWEFLDKKGIVGITRTRTMLWVNTDSGRNPQTVGILLVDPTAKEGIPLWNGYRNWAPVPSMNSKETPPAGPPRTSLFNDIVYWVMSHKEVSPKPSNSLRFKQILALVTLDLACAEWNIMCELITARLAQVEWEVGFPNHFGAGSAQDLVHLSLQRLHSWRRLVPLYRQMLNEATNEVIPFLSRLTTRSPVTSDPHQIASEQCDFSDIKSDLEKVSIHMKELQERTDRITSVLTATMSLDASYRGLDENRNLARLTWLASVFIPLTFVAGVFSMQQDIKALKFTFAWYFAAAVPITALAIAVAMNIHRIPYFKNKGQKKRSGSGKHWRARVARITAGQQPLRGGIK